MVASTAYNYEADPDINAFAPKKKTTSAVESIPTVAPKKSTMSGKNPELQFNDYENDPDIVAFTPGKHNISPIQEAPIPNGPVHQMLVRHLTERQKAEQYLKNQIVGVAEVGANVLTNMVAAPVASVGGVLGSLFSGEYGTQKGIQAGEAVKQKIMEAGPYQPRTEQGKANLEALGKAADYLHIGSALPEAQGFAPLVGPAASQLGQQFARAKAGLPKVRVETMPTVNGMQSAGSAAANAPGILEGNVNAALAEASPELQAHIQTQPLEKVNVPALETRVLEEKHGVNLTTGQRSGDTSRYTQEWNRRGETEDLTNHFKEQPIQLANAFEKSKIRHAPDIPSTADASELGQHEINGLAEKDKIRTDAIKQAYKDLTDANGGTLPLDIGTLKENINSELTKNLKSRYLRNELQGDLNDFYKNPTFESFEAVRSNLAEEMRSASDGKARQAAWIARNQLEKLPIFGEEGGDPQAIKFKELADKARSLYAERQGVIKSNPAYKAAIKESADLEDANNQGESLNAANFHKKYVSSATPEAIRRMKSEIAPEHIANQAITFGELERAKNAIANPNATSVKSNSFADFMKKDAPKVKESLTPGAMQDLMEIGLLNSKIAKPDAGAFNYSNTYTALIGDLAKQGILGAAELKLAGMTSGASVPVIGFGKSILQKHSKDVFAKEAIDPKGGLTKE